MTALFISVIISLLIGYLVGLLYSLFHFMYFQFPGVVVEEDHLQLDPVFSKELTPALGLCPGDRLVKKRFSLSLYINERKRNLSGVVVRRSFYYWSRISAGIVCFTMIAVVLMKVVL